MASELHTFSTEQMSSTCHQDGVRRYNNTKSPFKHKNTPSRDKVDIDNQLTTDNSKLKTKRPTSKAGTISNLALPNQDSGENSCSDIFLRQRKDGPARKASLLLLQMQNNKIVVLP